VAEIAILCLKGVLRVLEVGHRLQKLVGVVLTLHLKLLGVQGTALPHLVQPVEDIKVDLLHHRMANFFRHSGHHVLKLAAVMYIAVLSRTHLRSVERSHSTILCLANSWWARPFLVPVPGLPSSATTTARSPALTSAGSAKTRRCFNLGCHGP